MKISYHHPAQTSQQKSAPQFVRAQAQLSLLVADPARRITAADVGEIRRAVAIGAMSQPKPGDTCALYLDLAEQFGLSVRAVMDIVAGRRLGDGARA